MKNVVTFHFNISCNLFPWEISDARVFFRSSILMLSEFPQSPLKIFTELRKQIFRLEFN